MQDAHETARAAVRAKQANSRNCFVCGLENAHGLGLRFYETQGGEVISEYIVPEHFEGYPGVAHGGVVAAMLDEVSSRAGMVEAPNRFMVTAKLRVSYRKPVPVGQPLRLVGRLIRRRGRVAVARGEVHLPDGSLAADAEGMFVELPGPVADSQDLASLGWKVYPD
jgi:uncharacterized protein (TIGR00369 family)